MTNVTPALSSCLAKVSGTAFRTGAKCYPRVAFCLSLSPTRSVACKALSTSSFSTLSNSTCSTLARCAPVCTAVRCFGSVKYHGSVTTTDDSRAFRCTDISALPPSERSKVDEDLDGVYVLPHFRNGGPGCDPSDWRQPHPVWSEEELHSVVEQHLPPRGFVDWAAYSTVMFLRKAYDSITGYSWIKQNEHAMLRRVIVLETVAGVPGMVGALVRHLRSLRSMRRDYGWIHTLLEEAENERMHLMTAMILRQPSIWVKITVLGAQGFFFPFYSLMYLISPRYCHRMVGYLEEQAVVTYSHIVELIDQGELPGFLAEAPATIRKYWRLPEGATLRDVFLAIRADEDHHREVNHTFAEVQSCDAANPFPPGF